MPVRKRNIKWSPIDLKIYGDFLWTRRSPRSKRVGPEEPQGLQKDGGRAQPPGRALRPCGWLVDSCDMKPTPKIPINAETPEKKPRSGVPPPQASVATKNLSGPCPGTLTEGESITSGHLHHPDALHDEEGVVHPRGWGFVPVAMCLISLSLVFLRWYDLDVSRALLLYLDPMMFLPPLLSCNELNFPFWSYLIRLSL